MCIRDRAQAVETHHQSASAVTYQHISNQMVAFHNRAIVICNQEVAHDSRDQRSHREDDSFARPASTGLASPDERQRIRRMVWREVRGVRFPPWGPDAWRDGPDDG